MVKNNHLNGNYNHIVFSVCTLHTHTCIKYVKRTDTCAWLRERVLWRVHLRLQNTHSKRHRGHKKIPEAATGKRL
jgi:hypothetical protein